MHETVCVMIGCWMVGCELLACVWAGLRWPVRPWSMRKYRVSHVATRLSLDDRPLLRGVSRVPPSRATCVLRGDWV